MKPRQRIPTLLAAAAACQILALLVAACGGKDTPESPVILRVNGTPVTLEEFDDQLSHELTFRKVVNEGEKTGPNELTMEELKARIINESLIPLAAVKSTFAETIPELLKKAESIRSKISKDRSNFGALSSEYSTPSTAASKGRLGFFSRSGGLPFPLTRVAFSMSPEEVSEPFLSLAGCHILYVKKIVEGANDALDRVEAHHILLTYVEDETFLQTGLPRLLKDVRIEVVDPAFEGYVDRGNP